MAKTLTEKLVTVVDTETKQWVKGHAEKMQRSEGSILRLALRDYRVKMTRRKDG